MTVKPQQNGARSLTVVMSVDLSFKSDIKVITKLVDYPLKNIISVSIMLLPGSSPEPRNATSVLESLHWLVCQRINLLIC